MAMRFFKAAVLAAAALLNCAGDCRGLVLEQEFIFSRDSLKFTDAGGYQIVSYRGEGTSWQVGAPLLPMATRYLLLPTGYKMDYAHVEVLESQDIAGLYNVCPAQPAVTPGQTQPWVGPDTVVYGSPGLYPLAPAKSFMVGYLSGYNIGGVSLSPVQYYPQQKTLRFNARIRASLHLSVDGNMQGIAGANQGTVELWRNALERLVYNKNDIYAISPYMNAEGNLLPPGDYQYVVITSQALAASFAALINFKISRGVTAIVKTVEDIDASYTGADLPDKIRNFIIDAHSPSGWNTQWVLLGGDVEVVPARIADLRAQSLYQNACDLYYGALDGNWNGNGNGIYGEMEDGVDLLPEVNVGRAPVGDEAEADVFVNKVIGYETATTTESYTRSAAMLGYVLFGSLANPYGKGYFGHLLMERISEFLGDFSITRVYDDQAGCAPAMEALNNGNHIVCHTAHSEWDKMGVDGEFLYRNDIDALSNGNRQSIVYTTGCQLGKFDDDCIGEHFINNPGGGAVAFMGHSNYASAAQIIPANDITQYPGPYAPGLQHEFFRILLNEANDKVGQTLNAGKINFSAQAANNAPWRSTLYQANLMGDPEMRIRLDWVKITSPEEYETLLGYTVAAIRWETSENTGISGFDLHLSKDWGATWEPIALNIEPTARSYDWWVPNEYLANCVVRITAVLTNGASMSNSVNVAIQNTIVGEQNALRGISVVRAAPSSDKLIWVVGANGQVKKITGYNTITDVVIGIEGFDQHLWNFRGVCFTDENSGWIVGYKRTGNDMYKGVILKTSNGGGEWERLPNPLSGTPDSLTPFLKVKVVKPTMYYQGYISCGNGYILKLLPDGTWEPRRPPIPNNGYISPWYNSLWTDPTNATYVWAGADNGCLYAKSNNGGLNWDFETPDEFGKEYSWPPHTYFNAVPQAANLAAWCKNYDNAFAGMSHGLLGKYVYGNWYAQYPAPGLTWLYGLDSLRLCGSYGKVLDYQGNDVLSDVGTTFYDVASWKGALEGCPYSVSHSCAVGSNGRIVFEEPFFYFLDFNGAAVPGYRLVTLDWNTGGSSDQGLYRYEIYRSTSEINYGDKITSIVPNGSGNYSYVDNGLQWSYSYHYWIKAIMLNGRSKYFYVGYANPTGLGQPPYYPDPPTNVQAGDVPGDNGGKIHLSWTPGIYRGFYIGRKTSSETSFKPIAVVYNPSYTDNATKDGEIYQYAVASFVFYTIDFASCIVISNNASSSDNAFPEQIPLVGGFFDNNNKNITIYWQESPEPNLGGYWVCPEPLGKFASELPPSGVPDDYHVEHSSPIDRTTYKYRVPDSYIGQTLGFAVTAMDRSGNIAPWSPTVNINTNVTTQSTSPQATAYNNGRKLVYDKDGNLHLAYVSNDSVFYQKSWDDGYSWTPAQGLSAGGKDPKVSMFIDGDDIILCWSAVLPGYGYQIMAARKSVSGWDMQLVDEGHGSNGPPFWTVNTIGPPSVTVKNDTVYTSFEKNIDTYSQPYDPNDPRIPLPIYQDWYVMYKKIPVSLFGTGGLIAKSTVLDHVHWELPPHPALPLTSASICLDSKKSVHVAWSLGGEIYWRMYDPFTTVWRSKVCITNTPGVYSSEPSLSIYGDVHLVWQEGNDISHISGNWGYTPEVVPPLPGNFWWSEPQNISSSPGTASLWPVYDGGYAAWSEEMSSGVTEACCAHYSDFLWKQIPGFSKNPTQPSNYPHIAYRQNTDGGRMVTVWTEGAGPLYSLIARDTAGQVTPQFAADLGGAEPSPYTIERDGFLVYGNGTTVDYDSTELLYQLPHIDASQEQELELSFYQETGDTCQYKVYVNDHPLGVANVASGEAFVFDKKLPPPVKQGEGVLRLENMHGAVVACDRWQSLAYDRATGRGGGLNKSNNSAGQNPVCSPIYHNELMQNAPNPCARQTYIKYQLAKTGKTSLKVYNTMGQLVRILVDDEKPAGHHSVAWDGRDNNNHNVTAGVYFYRLMAGGYDGTKRMVVLR